MIGLESVKAKIEKCSQFIEPEVGQGVSGFVIGWMTTVPVLVRTSLAEGAIVLETKEFFSPVFTEALWAYNFWYRNVVLDKKIDMQFSDGVILMDCR